MTEIYKPFVVVRVRLMGLFVFFVLSNLFKSLVLRTDSYTHVKPNIDSALKKNSLLKIGVIFFGTLSQPSEFDARI